MPRSTAPCGDRAANPARRSAGSSARISVYVTEPVHPQAQELLARSARVDVGDEDMSPEELRRRVADVNVILSKTDPVPIDSEIIDAAPRLRLIARHGSGYSNVDVEHATERGIVVTNTPGVNAVTIAEYTVGLMIAAARRLVPAASACRAGAPDRLCFLGHELSGKTFGIVGVGRIGREVVQRVSALGMGVLAHHPRPSARNLADLPLTLVDLDTLLEESDVVSLHVPLNEQTRNLIGARELALMKPTAILLNLSRGGVVDERALYDALERKAIDAAATDVLAAEPVSAWEPLLRLDNCLVLPHIASVTAEAQKAVAMAAVEEILRFSRGQALRHVVNPTALAAAGRNTRP